MTAADSHKDPEAGLLLPEVIDEKKLSSTLQDGQSTRGQPNSRRQNRYRRRRRPKMPAFHRLVLSVLIIAFLMAAYASAVVHRRPQRPCSPKDEAAFQELLSSVSDASLHEVLQQVYDKYKHGVYPEDRTAIRAVHDDDAAVATSLVELAKRQSSNTTSVAADPPPSTVIIISTTSTSTVVAQAGTTTIVETSTPGSPTETSSPPQVSPTTPGVSPSASSFPPSQANSSSQTSATSTPVNTTTSSSSSTTSESSSTSSSSSTAVSSTSKASVTPQSSSTAQFVFTTTLPNGSQSTVTAFTVVPAGDQTTGPGGARPTSTGSPSLQNGAVNEREPRVYGIIGTLMAAMVFVVGVL